MLIPLTSLRFFDIYGDVSITKSKLHWYGICKSRIADNCKEDCFEAVVDFLKFGQLGNPQDYKVFYTNIFSFTKEEIFKEINSKKRF